MAQSRSSSASGGTKKRTASTRSTAARSTTAKRSTGTKSSRSNSAPKRSNTAQFQAQQPKQPAASAKPAAQNNVGSPNNQIRSVLWFAVGILILLFAWIKGTKVWTAVHTILLGLFGINARILVPVIIMYAAYLIGQERGDKASHRVFWGILLTFFVSGFWQLFIGKTTWTEGFKETIKGLYEEGENYSGGGLIAGVIDYPLIAFAGEIGARIILILLIGVMLMLLTNKSIPDLFHICCHPFAMLGNGVKQLALKGAFYYDEDDDEDDTDDDIDEDTEEERSVDEDAEQFGLGFLAELPRRVQKRRLEHHTELLPDGNDLNVEPDVFDNIDVDVPLADTDPKLTPAETNLLAEETHPDETYGMRMSDEEEAALQEMIANAEGSNSNQMNLLPWADDDDDNTEADESIYQEEAVVPYIAPPLTLLSKVDNTADAAEKAAELREKSRLLVETLASFGVEVRIVGMRRGPSVTRYEIQPAAGVKISKITALADDIGMNLGGEKVRIEAPIPGKPAVGVEVANNTKDMVPIRDILESAEFQESKSKLTFAVGKDIDGNVILGDIAKMPHMIIAGTTGSGKSVCTNSIIMSVLFHASPDEVKLVLIDPKIVEFAPYDSVPHLLIPVVTNPQKAAGALNWAVIEMERRYTLCAQYGVRDLKGYNALAERNEELKKLPQILIIIDEFADLMMSCGKEVESSVIRIAQKARAAGIHLIIATQRPTVDVITGLIKANVPSRIGMSVKSAQDSRIILDCPGAETLLGNGDLLFYPNGWREPKRVQGCFCSDAEVEAVTSFLKNNGTSEYDAEIMEAVEQNIPTAKGEKPMGMEDSSEVTGDEELVIRAAEYAVDAGQLSTTALQRRLKLGYARAARIVDELEERGIVAPSEGAKPRKVLMSPQELTEWKLRTALKGGKFEE